jgi:hypothetical protein
MIAYHTLRLGFRLLGVMLLASPASAMDWGALPDDLEVAAEPEQTPSEPAPQTQTPAPKSAPKSTAKSDAPTAASALPPPIEVLIGEAKAIRITSTDQRIMAETLRAKEAAMTRAIDALKNFIESTEASGSNANWSGQAMIEIGLLFADFAETLRTSPNPEGLNQNQLQIYRSGLRKLISPKEKKAYQWLLKAKRRGARLSGLAAQQLQQLSRAPATTPAGGDKDVQVREAGSSASGSNEEPSDGAFVVRGTLVGTLGVFVGAYAGILAGMFVGNVVDLGRSDNNQIALGLSAVGGVVGAVYGAGSPARKYGGSCTKGSRVAGLLLGSVAGIGLAYGLGDPGAFMGVLLPPVGAAIGCLKTFKRAE